MGSKNSKASTRSPVNRTVYGLDAETNPFDDLKYVKIINFGQYEDRSSVTRLYVNVTVPEDELADFLSVVYRSGYFIGDPRT